jgi:hypothetical protein
MGTFWAAVVWVVAGLFAFVVSLGSYVVSSEPLKDEEAGRRLPRIAYSRGLFGGLMAVVVTYLLLSGTVPVDNRPCSPSLPREPTGPSPAR